MRPIAIFDTNVLLSGIGWKGKPFQCLELARSGAIDAVTCREILEELMRKLESKLSFSPEQTVATVADLLTFLRMVHISGEFKVVAADPDDDKVLQCAVTAGATYIVTGDRRHLLPMVSFRGIWIITASDFLAKVAGS